MCGCSEFSALNFLDGQEAHNVEFYTFKYDPEVFGLNPKNSIQRKIRRFTGIAPLMSWRML